jgi:hypothetical protein
MQVTSGIKAFSARSTCDQLCRTAHRPTSHCEETEAAVRYLVRVRGLQAAKRRRGDSAMARTYREIAIEEMLRTVEEAMSQVIEWWGDLPPPMKEAIEQFRTQLGAAIDSVEFVKRALDRQVHEN